MNNLSFSNFLKNEEEDYFSALRDQLGIHPDDFKKDPKVASFFSFGSNITNIGPYSILDFKKNDDGKITHVLVKQINDPKIKNINYVDDKKVKLISDEKFLISIDDLQKLIMQGQDQPQADPSMGGIV
jgi:hypothetical protein